MIINGCGFFFFTSRRRHHKSKKSKHDHDSRDEKKRSKGGQGDMSKADFEIQEANKLRASLGLAPLRP